MGYIQHGLVALIDDISIPTRALGSCVYPVISMVRPVNKYTPPSRWNHVLLRRAILEAAKSTFEKTNCSAAFNAVLQEHGPLRPEKHLRLSELRTLPVLCLRPDSEAGRTPTDPCIRYRWCGNQSP